MTNDTGLTKRLERRIREYSLSPFSYDKGDRGELIKADLWQNGYESDFDRKNNLWARKGNGEKRILITSHMDTVFGTNPEHYAIDIREGKIVGSLDNSLGCAISAEVMDRYNPIHSVYFVFTVGEENGCHGAEYVKSMVEDDFKPDVVIALDVTYPLRGSSYSASYSSGHTFSWEDPDDYEELAKYHGWTSADSRGRRQYNPLPRVSQRRNAGGNQRTSSICNHVLSAGELKKRYETQGNYEPPSSTAPPQNIPPPHNFVSQHEAFRAARLEAEEAMRRESEETGNTDEPVAFAENFASTDLQNYFEGFVKEIGEDKEVGTRSMVTVDEALVFNDDYNAFAFGPVVRGNMHGNDCRSNVRGLEAAIRVLGRIVSEKDFIEGLPKFEKRTYAVPHYPSQEILSGAMIQGTSDGFCWGENKNDSRNKFVKIFLGGNERKSLQGYKINLFKKGFQNKNLP